MLSKWYPLLSRLSVVLGSQSPRRSEILRDNLGLTFKVIVSGFAEDINKEACSGPADYVSKTCEQKAIGVVQQALSTGEVADIIIAADTIVVRDDTILEKPEDGEHAIAMLQTLSGRDHLVLTAVTIAVRRSIVSTTTPLLSEYVTVEGTPEFLYHTFVTSTAVTFAELSRDVLENYVATGEPMDKAGAYGIQGRGSSLVTAINGCYFNVVGFPVHNFAKHFSSLLDHVSIE